MSRFLRSMACATVCAAALSLMVAPVHAAAKKAERNDQICLPFVGPWGNQQCGPFLILPMLHWKWPIFRLPVLPVRKPFTQ